MRVLFSSQRPYLLLCGLCLWSIVTACSAPNQSLVADPVRPVTPLTIEQLLDTQASDPGRRLVAIAQKRLGSPYRYGGTGPEGFDCSGLVYSVHRDAGYRVPRTSRDQYRSAQKVALDHLGPGDLVFFNISANKVSHVGIYVEDDLFIHSPSSGKGVSYASLSEEYWRKRLVGAGRLY